MKKVPIIVLWAIAFAYVESAVVEYLRALYYPLQEGGFHFPLQTLAELQALGQEHVTRLWIELGRELATMVMLGTVAACASRNAREGWGHFLIAFGIWDIFYYIWLLVFLDWPPSLWTWDLLFLVPAPWIGPVIAPIVISAVMILCGTIILFCEHRGIPLRTSWTDWVWFVSGGLMVIVAFCWDYEAIVRGGVPRPFHWGVFFVGLATGCLAFAAVVRRNLAIASPGPRAESD